jgi:hypothetical protein
MPWHLDILSGPHTVGQDTGEKGKGRERNMHKGEKRKMGIK